ncbi:MAG: class I SAM-dependent methyltransferase [Candidatus Hermodarchaeota archaeon]|nr:class I SAM-dependent methyltransferase [Candidatus Hermodarchaeota archaeon]
MGIYDAFAPYYASGGFTQYSQRMTEAFPSLMRHFNQTPETILDLACGEGTFAISMAQAGYQVTGIDRSPAMLKLAKTKSRTEKVSVTWRQLEMQHLEYENSFDIVTCWFDSLNYLLELDDLCATFKGVHNALRENGLFVFDMNTIYWLVTLAQRYAVTVERETEEIFQVHRHSYDFDKNIATFYITAFVKEKDRWLRRVDEIHKERGYTIGEIQECLKDAGFQELACWGDLEDQSPLTKESRRVYFITQK